MITGVVNDREARIRLSVRGPQQREQEIEAVVDTGYTASLSLPPVKIATLDLDWQGIGRGTLADGSECLFDVYEAEVLWDGQLRRLLVDEADTDPLVGMALLSGYELKMEVCSQGKLEIAPLIA
jgi:clan AA aspartic protease